MRLYLFRSAPKAYSALFQQSYLSTNLKAVRVLALVWLVIALLVLASDLVFDYAGNFQGAAVYYLAYFSYAISGVVILLVAWWLSKATLEQQYGRYVYLSYAFIFTITCLLMSVAVQGSPINNMTMYLMGLVLVSTLVVMELYELIIIATCVEAVFVIGASFLNLPTERIIMNQTGSVFLIIFFFLVSRLNYSFRLNHFMQLKQIEEKNQELEKLTKAKSDILAVVAHDLQGPFANIEMLAKMLQNKRMPVEQEGSYYEMILKSCHSSKVVINDLLEMARYEQEEEVQLLPVSLNELLLDLEQDWQIRLKNSRQLVVQHTLATVMVKANSSKFKRVLDNLISNAVKFTRANGVITLSMSQQTNYVQLFISDNGIGIPQEMWSYLFEPFSKASRIGMKGEKSIGLGLSIARKLIEQQGGTIDIMNGILGGTTFCITLPVHEYLSPELSDLYVHGEVV